MRSDFFVERYALERHQGHLREVANDRLLLNPGRIERHVRRRRMRVQARWLPAAVVSLIRFARYTRLRQQQPRSQSA